MKWRVKILYIITFTLFAVIIAAMALLTFYEPKAEKNFQYTLPDEAVFSVKVPENAAERRFLPRTSAIEPQKSYAASHSDPAGRIHAAAERVLRSVLPQGSYFELPGTLQLTKHNSAWVSGLVITPEIKGRNLPEKRFRYRVQINFTPDGNCEAEFPVFSVSDDSRK